MPKSDDKEATSRKRTMTKVETNFVTLNEETPIVSGTLTEKGSMTFNTGGHQSVVGRYKLLTDSGVVQTVLGSTVIDDLLEAIPVGTFIQLTFEGWQLTASKMKVKKVALEVAS